MPEPRSTPEHVNPDGKHIIDANTAFPTLTSLLPDHGLQGLFADSLKIYRYPQEFNWDTGRWIAFRLVDPKIGLYNEAANRPQHLAAVVTHMPSGSLKTTYNVSYQSKELGAAGGPIAQQLWNSNLDKGPLEASKTFFDNAFAAGRAMLQEYSMAHEFEHIFDFAMRKQLNRHQQQVFNGVSFRQHNFKLTFSGKNPQESFAVDNIIQIFKLGMLPGYKSFLGSRHDLFFGFPYEWEISFHPDYEKTTFKILRSVLSSMTVDYAPHGPVAFHAKDSLSGGYRPVSVSVDLTFLEMVLLTRDMHVLAVHDGLGLNTAGISPIGSNGERDVLTSVGGRTYRF